MDYDAMTMFELAEVLLLSRNNRDAQRALQRKVKAAVANAPPFEITDYTGSFPAMKQGKLKTLRHDLVDDMVLDEEVNGDN